MTNLARLSPSTKRFCHVCRWLAVICLGTITYAFSATYYISPNGSDNAAGSLAQPFATLQKGNDVAVAGDTVYIRGGTYALKGAGASSTSGITLSKSGQSDGKRIYYWAYNNEVPVFDFSGFSISSTSAGAGITVTGSWLHLKGFEVCNVPEPGSPSNNGILNSNGSHNIFERLNSHHHGGTGMFIANGTGGHLVLNCDSHDNYDPNSNKGAGQNADGFGCHYQTSGDTTIFRGCRAWWNSDDGFDCINQSVAVRIENCWISLSGYVPGTMTPAASGNGNGFKVGGFDMPPTKYPAVIPRHVVRNCVAFHCKAAGFYQNHQLGPSYFYNNTSYNNRGGNFNMLGYDLATGAGVGMGIYRNNVAFTGTATSNASGADASFNSWDISGLTVAASDFLSIDTAGMYGPRKADGSLPDVKFMHLSATSKLIDIGTNVGLPYTGKVPDLGAYEYTAVSVAPSQTAIHQNVAVRTGMELKLVGFSRSNTPGVENSRIALYTITGQRIYPAGRNNGAGLRPGVYIEKRMPEGSR
jgi:hypothetical protein